MRTFRPLELSGTGHKLHGLVHRSGVRYAQRSEPREDAHDSRREGGRGVPQARTGGALSGHPGASVRRCRMTWFVHFGAPGLPMHTVRFKSRRAALRAVRDAQAEGWPARIQEAFP